MYRDFCQGCGRVSLKGNKGKLLIGEAFGGRNGKGRWARVGGRIARARVAMRRFCPVEGGEIEEED